MPVCTRPRPGYLLTTSRPCSLLVEKKKKKKVRTTTGLHVNRQRTHRNRFVSLSVASTSSEAENAEKNKSPGGVKMVGGNRPTSPKAWQIMYEALTASEVAPVTASDIEALKSSGAIIVDVRPANDFASGHIEGSVNVPLYQPITGWEPKQVLRKAAYAFFGVFNGTEANENFAEDVKKAAGLDKEIIVVCNTGGTLEQSTNFQTGKQSRSLMAAYDMLNLGFSKLSFLEGGYNQWYDEDREIISIS
mmetsp:Transcript_10499/g.28832  ORF Transcript_10499/g.28832 Transcript_10499/m.28832 type:complete len:247 (-) Transcript_10499:91-831(-)|eukprot:CAMPEP_0182608360 /NCGR_PEP_ID=MMETSP1330-20130603/2806_1 /TAXON_ID=464278 /ORGANISM="Picochlorum sp., Strain RCC944" /LENGTH=246 /DNA_ID=CAMNT_0024827103 /DNA_START=71 /DNA_END=811 /DNA_ORIENTATION=-